jgi:hypothetical protein
MQLVCGISSVARHGAGVLSGMTLRLDQTSGGVP